MKYLMIVLAGAADHPAEELGGKTPLEIAKIPNLNHFAKAGKVGQVKLAADRQEPCADIAFLNLLGYDGEKVFTGRGPIEAVNLGVTLEPNEVAFRMNFITEADGILADASGGQLSTKEARALIGFLNKKISSGFVRFVAGREYRHVAVLKDSHGLDALSARTTSPESFQGEAIEPNLPKGPGEELLKKLMYDAKLLLQDHEINQVRVDLGENPANMIWLWGQGLLPKLEKLPLNPVVDAAILSDIEYAEGIAKLAGMSVVPNIIGPEDEMKYEKLGNRFLETAHEKDFACLYLEASDKASRKGDLKAKVSAIEGVDYFILSKVREFMESEKESRLLVTTGYAIPWQLKKHTRDAAPFLVTGKNVVPDDIEKFSESIAKASLLKFGKGSELAKIFFQNEQPSPSYAKTVKV